MDAGVKGRQEEHYEALKGAVLNVWLGGGESEQAERQGPGTGAQSICSWHTR